MLIADPELRAVFIPIIRADVEVIDTYVYRREPPLDCPISAICGREDSINEKELAAWQQQTTGAFAQPNHMSQGICGSAKPEQGSHELRGCINGSNREEVL